MYGPIELRHRFVPRSNSFLPFAALGYPETVEMTGAIRTLDTAMQRDIRAGPAYGLSPPYGGFLY